MIKLPEMTLILPIQIDSDDRLENADIFFRYLDRYFDVKVLCLETAPSPNMKLKKIAAAHRNVKHMFMRDIEPLYHRTRFLNRLLEITYTPFAGIIDVDVILLPEAVKQACELLKAGTAAAVFPYDGRFLDVPGDLKKKFGKSLSVDYFMENIDGCVSLTPPSGASYGGAIFLHRETYLKCGYENENFISYGWEDHERYTRINTLGYFVMRTPGPLFHLTHYRGINSSVQNPRHKAGEELYFKRIKRMNRRQMEAYALELHKIRINSAFPLPVTADGPGRINKK